jgi:coproporphyrinogen III oxidase
MIDAQKKTAATWFSTLQSEIIATLQSLEDKASPVIYGEGSSQFVRTPWVRTQGGGGTMAVLEGRLFEKAGVNFSEVWGEFSEDFRYEIPGADEDPRFWASGISLVIHPRNPHVPIVHMNTRFIVTKKHWFGGGADLTPVFPIEKDTRDFHEAMKVACDAHDPQYYSKYKTWADEYFYIPHRNEARGVGGIFYDGLNSGNWDEDFAFTKDVGQAFHKIYPEIVERHMNTPWSEEDRKTQLIKRGRYVEFNLIYDRGTAFGLKTGGNTEAILMSMPPVVEWPAAA